MSEQLPNRLIHETSPYLLQHAYNPVDWYPFGEEAFELAKTTNRPLLISIGYSACHWCHVMEHESFSNPEIAAIMNRDFVCIKVDREERPDVDQVFMAAVQLLHSNGGWPLNCFALPDGRPFWGGTYFRPAQWTEMLGQISSLFNRNISELKEQAKRISEGIAGMSVIDPPADNQQPDLEFVNEMYNQLSLRFDTDYGGMIGAPKFPMPVVWEFVAGYYQLNKLPEALNQLSLTLRKMAMGGIFDQIGGGFARYSTDKYWKVPHFEKMLYDNAQLISLYSKVYALTGDIQFKDTLDKTLTFIKTEFTSEEGFFYAALDADSEGEEGRFYIWNRDQIKQQLPEYGDLVADYFGVGQEGAWEKGISILLRPLSDAVFASRQHLSEEELRQLIKMSSAILLKERNTRIKPGLDNKMIVSWNAMMIKSLVDSFHSTCNQSSKEAALKAAHYITDTMMQPDGSLLRTPGKAKAGISGFLDDYAFTIRAFISLYQLDYDEIWLFRAKQLSEKVFNDFNDEASPLFWYTPQKQAEQWSLVRVKEVTDGVEPSGNAVMAECLFLLGLYFEKHEWLKYSENMVMNMKNRIQAYPSSHSHWAQVVAMQVKGVTTVVATGTQARKYAETLRRKHKPYTIFAAAENESKLPIFNNRFKKDESLIYICRGSVCDAPVNNPNEIAF
ncbi:MAG: thioredoxin domain-containing protein [Bacteroidetes bacterium HGW-Bacteroidetes-11]|jgi:hypothetical protein|nr:MAG: thioredoxin domain-containing protein [Bacteroidetes bacterium HGW-Bacteroidetes-11]